MYNLGYENDEIVDNVVLGILISLTPIFGNTFPRYDLCESLIQRIHEQIEEFHIISFFRYPYYLFHMFLHQKFEYYKSLNLKMTDESGNPIPIFKWNDLILRKPNN